MPDSFNKFNSKSGFELNIDNVLSKIRLDFDTNVSFPDNYILGINDEQTQFVLIDPGVVNNTNQTDTTLDLATLSIGMLGKVNHYVFEKLIDPSLVGCSNCDASTDIKNKFIETGKLPIINREVIAEFEVNPNAIHNLEIELVGHRRICDDNGNCFDKWTESQDLETAKLVVNSQALTELTSNNKESHFNFIDYSCCPCCDAYTAYNNSQISLSEAESICNASNQYIKIDGVPYTSFSQYCNDANIKYIDEFDNIQQTISQCDLIEKTKNNYGAGVDPTLLNCSVKQTLEETFQRLTAKSSCPCGSDAFGCTCCSTEIGPTGYCCCLAKCLSSGGTEETCRDSCCDPSDDGSCLLCKMTVPECNDCVLNPDPTNPTSCCYDIGATTTTTTEPPPPTTTTEPPPPTTTTVAPTTTTTVAPTTTTTVAPTTTTTEAPTTTTAPPQPGWVCISGGDGDPSQCLQSDTSTCYDPQACCNCDLVYICDKMIDPTPPAEFNCTSWDLRPLPDGQGQPPCGKTIFQTLQLCEDASEQPGSRSLHCGDKSADCVNGVCIEVDDCNGQYPTITACRQSSTCGKYQCLKSTRTCEHCEFVSDTSIGFNNQQDCDTSLTTLCGKGTFECSGGEVCSDGRIIGGQCTPLCSGGEFDNELQCEQSNCEVIDYGPRYRCISNTCTYISPCIDPNPQQYYTNTCNNECGGIVCKNGSCSREEGNPGTYGNDEQCANDCECIVYLNRTGGYAGCSKCMVACGSDRRRENGGPCYGCDALGRNCAYCDDKFTSIQNCELYRIANNIVPHTCLTGRCIETDGLENPADPKYCGNYCSKTACENTCSRPKGYNCVRRSVLEEGNCEPVYCGTGEFSTYEECKNNCAAAPSFGYNCVSRTLNGRVVSDCLPASVRTDEDTGPIDYGEFQTYALCKTFCSVDYGWTCKGNKCVKATVEDGPGPYSTFKECISRCVVPNQTPCGDAYTRKIINRR